MALLRSAAAPLASTTDSGVTGDVTYYTGSQDIVDIIAQPIALYGSGGQVGAKGYMGYAGDAGSHTLSGAVLVDDCARNCYTGPVP